MTSGSELCAYRERYRRLDVLVVVVTHCGLSNAEGRILWGENGRERLKLLGEMGECVELDGVWMGDDQTRGRCSKLRLRGGWYTKPKTVCEILDRGGLGIFESG